MESNNLRKRISHPLKMDYLDVLREPLQQFADLRHPNFNDFYYYYQYLIENANVTSAFSSALSRFIFTQLENGDIMLNLNPEGRFIIVDVLNLANNPQFISNILQQGDARQSQLMSDLAEIVRQYGFISADNVRGQMAFLRRDQKVDLIVEIFSRIAQERPDDKFILVAGFRYGDTGTLHLPTQTFEGVGDVIIQAVPLNNQNLTLNLPGRQINVSVIFGHSVIDDGHVSMEADDLLALYLLALISSIDEDRVGIISADRYSFIKHRSGEDFWNYFPDRYKTYLAFRGTNHWDFVTNMNYYHPSMIWAWQ